MGFLKLLNIQGILGIVATIGLLIALGAQKIETRHWHKQSDQFEQLYHAEQDAHRKTVINYRQAAEAARIADAKHKADVEAQQARINKERDASYEARIADARVRAERLRAGEAAAHPGSPGTAPVPQAGPSAGGAAQASGQGGLSAGDALVATEQAIQLDELIKWIKSQPLLTPQDSSSSSPNGSK